MDALCLIARYAERHIWLIRCSIDRVLSQNTPRFFFTCGFNRIIWVPSPAILMFHPCANIGSQPYRLKLHHALIWDPNPAVLMLQNALIWVPSPTVLMLHHALKWDPNPACHPDASPRVNVGSQPCRLDASLLH